MKDDNEEMIRNRINYLKGILNEMLNEKDANNSEIIMISNQLDRLIVEYMRFIKHDM